LLKQQELGGVVKKLPTDQNLYPLPPIFIAFFKSLYIYNQFAEFWKKINVGSFIIELLKTNWRIFVFPITFNGKQKIQWVWKKADSQKVISATYCFYFIFIKSTYQSFTMQIYSQKST